MADINNAPTLSLANFSTSDYLFASDGGTALKKIAVSDVKSLLLGTTSISGIGDGTVNGALSALNSQSSTPYPRCKNITSYFTDGTLWNRISGSGYAHAYYDLMPGDYFDMGRTVICPNVDEGSSGGGGSQYVTIADLGGMYGNGDSNTITTPHLVMVPGQGLGGQQSFGRHRMNATNTTAGGYAGSVMNTAVIGDVVSSGSVATGATINQQLYYIFGSHLKTTREIVSNAVDTTKTHGAMTGVASGWAWGSYQAILMTEHEVYGASVWGDGNYNVGTGCRQLALFAMQKQAINNRSAYYWLRDVASSSHFAVVYGTGRADADSASDTSDYVRPRFVIA